MSKSFTINDESKLCYKGEILSEKELKALRIDNLSFEKKSLGGGRRTTTTFLAEVILASNCISEAKKVVKMIDIGEEGKSEDLKNKSEKEALKNSKNLRNILAATDSYEICTVTRELVEYEIAAQVMQYIPGITVRQWLEDNEPQKGRESDYEYQNHFGRDSMGVPRKNTIKRISLAGGVIDVLNKLHECNVIHGDPHTGNFIALSKRGSADFCRNEEGVHFLESLESSDGGDYAPTFIVAIDSGTSSLVKLEKLSDEIALESIRRELAVTFETICKILEPLKIPWKKLIQPKLLPLLNAKCDLKKYKRFLSGQNKNMVTDLTVLKVEYLKDESANQDDTLKLALLKSFNSSIELLLRTIDLGIRICTVSVGEDLVYELADLPYPVWLNFDEYKNSFGGVPLSFEPPDGTKCLTEFLVNFYNRKKYTIVTDAPYLRQ